MALIDTSTAPRASSFARDPERSVPVALSARPNPYQRSELRRRALPFLAAILIALALLPVGMSTEVDWTWLAPALLLLTAVVALTIALTRVERPGLLGIAVPYIYIVAIAFLREGTGGATSGYGVLLYLAPFWVALYDTRRQVYLTTLCVFLVQVGLPPLDGFTIRRALLSTFVTGFVSIAVHRKVTALREAQASVRREAEARAAAYEQLAENAAQLERSNHELEQFAYVSSHDIQEPLRMIRSFSQLFVQRYGDQIDESGHELLGFVVDGAERAQRLVNDLLQYSLVGRSERELVPVDLDASLDRALETLGPKLLETKTEIDRMGPLPDVRGDAPQLDSLFVNLVGNAIKYRHPDRPLHVRIASRRLEGMVEVTIEDNGIGFSPEHAEKIFLMFQRLHGRTSYEGTGIGLAICARIVERHDGVINAVGRPGEGATFRFTLPLATQDGPA